MLRVTQRYNVCFKYVAELLRVRLMNNLIVIFCSSHAGGLTVANSHQAKRKRFIGARGLFLHQQSKHTKEVAAFVTRPYTSKCHLWGFMGLMREDIPTVIHHPLMQGQGAAWTAARCEVHLCGRCCGARPLCLWSRWISYRCLCQHGPIRDQMHTCTCNSQLHSATFQTKCMSAGIPVSGQYLRRWWKQMNDICTASTFFQIFPRVIHLTLITSFSLEMLSTYSSSIRLSFCCL